MSNFLAASINMALKDHGGGVYGTGQGNPQAPGGGLPSDLSADQLYIGVPSFTQANATLNAVIGFVPWPWDPRTVSHTVPSEWPSAESTGNYFIDPDHPSATDTANTYGYPDQPRASMPDWSTVPAGAVVEVGGGTFDAVADFDMRNTLGTAQDPIFVRGSDGLAVQDMPLITGGSIRAEGCQYLIFEQFRRDGNVANGNTSNNCFGTGYNGSNAQDTSHIVFRNNRFENIAYISGGAPIVSVSADDRNGGKQTRYVCIYNNVITGEGETAAWTVGPDQDHHGVGFSSRSGEDEGPGGRTEVSLVWVIDNFIKYTSGNGVQVISVGTPTKDHRDRVKYCWIAGNETGESRQAGLWSKRASHIIFSQNSVNEALGHYFAGNGQASGCQYGPTEVWYLANYYSNCDYGIQQTDTGTESGAPDGNLYCIGNIFFDLNIDNDQIDSWRDGTALSFTTHGNMNRYVQLNTVYGAVNGVVFAASATVDGGSNVFMLWDGDLGGAATSANEGKFYQADNDFLSMNNDFLYRINGTWEVEYDNTDYNTVGAVNALGDFSNLSDSNPLLTDPASGDPANGDFTPQVGSPVIGAGSYVTQGGIDLRQRFLDQYGLDIAYDFLGNSRNPADMACGAVEAA